MKMFDDLVKKVFEKYPNVKPAYVLTGIKLAFLMAKLLKGIMLHLILVQDLDPNNPHKKMMEELNRLFDKRDEKSYDEDFDFSWVKTGHNNVKSSFSKNHPASKGVSFNDHKKMTDLSQVSDKPVQLSESTAIALEAARSAIISQLVLTNDLLLSNEFDPDFDKSDPKLDAKFKQTSEFLKRVKENSISQIDSDIEMKGASLKSIKEGLHTLKKYAADLEGSDNPTNKSPKFKGTFRRSGK
jgi:hypothetical protein